MAEKAPTPGKPLSEAAAAAVSPDPITAQILAKHAAGETLLPKESGKMGAWKAKLNKLVGKGGSPAGAAAPGPGQAAGVASLPSGAAELDPLAVPPPSADVVKRTTAAVLGSADQVAQRYMAREARKVAADDRTTNRLIAAAALPPPTKDLMVETSPDFLAALGVDPRSFPITVFLGGLGLWASNLWLCVDELKAKHADKNKPATTAAPASTAAKPESVASAPFSTPTPATLPAPAQPANAPPDVQGKK